MGLRERLSEKKTLNGFFVKLLENDSPDKRFGNWLWYKILNITFDTIQMEVEFYKNTICISA